MRAPLDLTHRVLMSQKLRLAPSTHHRLARRRSSCDRRLDHPAVPDTRRAVDARAREHERPVLVPVERKHLPARRGHRQRGLRERARERICARARRVCGRAQVEEPDGAVRRARREHGGRVWAERGLVSARGVRLQGLHGVRALRRPLRRLAQARTRADTRAGTHYFDHAVPGRGDELVLVQVGPVDGEDLAGVLVPGADGQVLAALCRRRSTCTFSSEGR